MSQRKDKYKSEDKTGKEDIVWLIPASKWIKENSRQIQTSLTNAKVNRSLLLDKYIQCPFDNKEGNIKFKDRGGRLKKVNIEKIQGVPIPISQSDYIFLKDRKNSHSIALNFTLKTVTRLIVNHGGESVLESNIALHPYYGFPIIPGSAIKGVTRHYCEEYKKMNSEEIIEIFGSEPAKTPAKEGGVVFMDAWPASFADLNSLELDVITPHYKNYYSDKDLPSDAMDPEPHLFLSVRKDTCFEFSICHSSSFKGDKNDLLNKTKLLIIKALSTFGVGAKTGSSYGYFK